MRLLCRVVLPQRRRQTGLRSGPGGSSEAYSQCSLNGVLRDAQIGALLPKEIPMKRLLSTLPLLALIMSLAACSGGGGGDDGGGGSESSSEWGEMKWDEGVWG